MKAWEDPRVVRGMQAQLARRRERIAAGETPLGWKLGFGAPAAMEMLNLTGPLVGYLMQGALLASGARADVTGWTQVVAEPEIGVRLGADLAAGADRAAAAGGDRIADAGDRTCRPRAAADPATTSTPCWPATSISAMSCLAPTAAKAATPPDLSSHVFRRGTLAAETADPQALTGRIPDLLVHFAGTLAAFGEQLKAGDLVICGSTVPPPLIEPDETEFRYELRPIGAVSVRFSRS